MGWRVQGGLFLAILILSCKADDVSDAMEMSDAHKEADRCPVIEQGPLLGHNSCPPRMNAEANRAFCLHCNVRLHSRRCCWDSGDFKMSH